jgi:hypothetical protein
LGPGGWARRGGHLSHAVSVGPSSATRVAIRHILPARKLSARLRLKKLRGDMVAADEVLAAGPESPSPEPRWPVDRFVPIE